VAGEAAVYGEGGAGGFRALIHEMWNAIPCGSWLACEDGGSVDALVD